MLISALVAPGAAPLRYTRQGIRLALGLFHSGGNTHHITEYVWCLLPQCGQEPPRSLVEHTVYENRCGWESDRHMMRIPRNHAFRGDAASMQSAAWNVVCSRFRLRTLRRQMRNAGLGGWV